MSGAARRLRSCALIAAIVAAFVTGVGTAVYPRWLEGTDWMVCRGASRLEVQKVRASYHRPGEFSLRSTCVDAAGSASGDRTSGALGAMALTWFAMIFVPLALYSPGNPRERTPALPPGTPIALDAETRARVMELLRSMKLIQAIREIRTATGLGLKESKDVAEALMANPDAYPAAEPASVDPAASPAAPVHDEGAPTLARLRELKRMRDDGLITTAEYQAKKAELLARM